jgi:cell division protein FtsB
MVKHIVVPEHTYNMILEQVKPRIEKVEHHKVPAKPISGIVQRACELVIEAVDAGSLEDAEWIYSPKTDPSNDQIVQLLRKSNDPKLARYLYKTFGMRRTPDADFIFKEMCDEDSPFFLPYVKDALSNLITLKEEKDSVAELQKKRQRLQDEIEELQTEAQSLTNNVDELTTQKTQFEQEIADYNKQMTRIATFEPIDAVDIIFNVLDEAERREKPGRDWDAELLKRLVEARDHALKLRDHYHTFDMVRMGDVQEKKRLEDVKEIEYLIDRNFPKWWKRLQAELDAIKEAHDYEAEQITHGNYWISADHYYTMDKIRNKIENTFIGKN